MTRLFNIQLRCCFQHRFHGIHFFTETRFGKNKINLSKHIHIICQIFNIRHKFCTEFMQNTRHFIPFCTVCFAQIVVHFHYSHRLDKQSSTAGRLVMNNPRNLTAIFLFYRYYIPIISNGNQCILQIFGTGFGTHNVLQSFTYTIF